VPDPSAAAFGTVDATVATFDDHRGYGTLRTAEGAELFFHCTALVDGSRTVDVGTAVTAEVVPGRLGRWEATRIVTRRLQAR
jgi:cold shock CspA family protein